MKDGNFEVVAALKCSSGQTASANNTVQMSYPETYSDTLFPRDFTSMDLGFFSEISLTEDGKTFAINARQTYFDGWDIFKETKDGCVRMPRFGASEIRTVMTLETDTPIFLFPSKDNAADSKKSSAVFVLMIKDCK